MVKELKFTETISFNEGELVGCHNGAEVFMPKYDDTTNIYSVKIMIDEIGDSHSLATLIINTVFGNALGDLSLAVVQNGRVIVPGNFLDWVLEYQNSYTIFQRVSTYLKIGYLPLSIFKQLITKFKQELGTAVRRTISKKHSIAYKGKITIDLRIFYGNKIIETALSIHLPVYRLVIDLNIN